MFNNIFKKEKSEIRQIAFEIWKAMWENGNNVPYNEIRYSEIDKDDLDEFVINTKEVNINHIKILVKVLKRGTRVSLFNISYGMGMALYNYSTNDNTMHVYINEEVLLNGSDILKNDFYKNVHKNVIQVLIKHEIGHLMTLTNMGREDLNPLIDSIEKTQLKFEQACNFLRMFNITKSIKLYNRTKFILNHTFEPYAAATLEKIKVKIYEDAANLFVIENLKNHEEREAFLGYLDFLVFVAHCLPNVAKVIHKLKVQELNNYMLQKELYNRAIRKKFN